MQVIRFCLFFIIQFFIIQKTYAVCPVCTVAVGSGIGFFQYLGVDDSIIGLWIGGLIVSMILWTESFFDKRKIFFKGRLLVDILFYYIIVILPLYYYGFKSYPIDLYLFSIDKVLLGIIVGSISFWFGNNLHKYLKESNNGKVYFPFQKVVIPIASIAFVSIIFYLITK